MGVADYSDIEQEIKEAPEPKTLPRGSEVKARIIGMRSGVNDKNHCQWYQPIMDVPSDPLVNEFNDFFWDLADRHKLDAKQAARSLTKFKNFAAAFDLDYSQPFDWENDLIGLEGWVILGVKKSDDYGNQNTISKYVTGQQSKRKNEDIPF